MKSAKEFTLTLSAYRMNIINWNLYRAYRLHLDIIRQIGIEMRLGEGMMTKNSMKKTQFQE